MAIIAQGATLHHVEPAPKIDPSMVSTTMIIYMGPNIYLDVFMRNGEFHRIEHFPPRNDVFELERQLQEAK
ncbi:hypothetical protein [Pseudomonas sp. Xaverov 259]|uniref:hypothetical protein n=1 Tax=Pseudomonas sp. Xaverov 259 TaxID=2666086 RepID=UPI001C5ABF4B|nr:hypothetical protein [Pseudomonas sp. Xaverov 259]